MQHVCQHFAAGGSQRCGSRSPDLLLRLRTWASAINEVQVDTLHPAAPSAAGLGDELPSPTGSPVPLGRCRAAIVDPAAAGGHGVALVAARRSEQRSRRRLAPAAAPGLTAARRMARYWSGRMFTGIVQALNPSSASNARRAIRRARGRPHPGRTLPTRRSGAQHRCSWRAPGPPSPSTPRVCRRHDGRLLACTIRWAPDVGTAGTHRQRRVWLTARRTIPARHVDAGRSGASVSS